MHDFAEALVPLFAIIFTFGIPGIIIFWHLHSRHKERMRLIEKGLTPEEVRAYYTTPNIKKEFSFSALKWGLLLTFIGLGFFISIILSEVADVTDDVIPAFVIFFAGLGFIVYYLMVNSKIKNMQTNGVGTGASTSTTIVNNP